MTKTFYILTVSRNEEPELFIDEQEAYNEAKEWLEYNMNRYRASAEEREQVLNDFNEEHELFIEGEYSNYVGAFIDFQVAVFRKEIRL